MAQLYISLGTSIERDKYLHQGLTSLHDAFGELTLSSLFESEAIGFEGPDFYNMVIGVTTELSIDNVAQLLKAIELQHGREVNPQKYSPRTLDLDLLLFDDLILEKPAQIPRNEITQNAFVLRPLAEIAGKEIHPVIKQSYDELWSKYNKDKQRLTKVPFYWQMNNNEMDNK